MSDAPLDLTALEVLTEPVEASRTVAGAPRDGAAERQSSRDARSGSGR